MAHFYASARTDFRTFAWPSAFDYTYYGASPAPGVVPVASNPDAITPFSYDGVNGLWTALPFGGTSSTDYQTLLEIMGSGLVQGGDGMPVSGTVTGFQILSRTFASSTVLGTTLYGTSISAAALKAASSTISRSDDITLLRQALAGHDTMRLSSGENNYVFAHTGNDTVQGGAGSDTMLGEAGNDSLIGSANSDLLDGGDGSDVLFGDSASGFSAGNDTLRGGAAMTNCMQATAMIPWTGAMAMTCCLAMATRASMPATTPCAAAQAMTNCMAAATPIPWKATTAMTC